MTVRLGFKTGNTELDRALFEIATMVNRLEAERARITAVSDRVTTLAGSAAFADAPQDGQVYARKDGAWEVVTGGAAGDHLLLEDGAPPVTEYLLLEDGSYLLLESGDRLLKEAS